MKTKIRALSWKNPYAALMLHGKIETRSWNTNYRGWVLICASQAPYSASRVGDISGVDLFTRIFLTLGTSETGVLHLNGYAIAIGKLIDCRPMTPDDEKKCFVKYQEGLFCHVYEDVKSIKPFPWKGSQGWKKLTEEQIKPLLQYINE